MQNQEIKPTEQGRWTSATWRLYLQDAVPDESRVTAVFGVPIHPDGLVMTHNHRGWELPGGHLEKGETIQQALEREILEEAGITEFTASERLLGYLEIIDDNPKINKATGEYYPNPSYIVYFAVSTDGTLGQTHGEETLGCAIYPFNNLPHIEGETALRTIKHLLPKALSTLNRYPNSAL